MEPRNRSDLAGSVRNDAASSWIRASAAVRLIRWHRYRAVRGARPGHAEWDRRLRPADLYRACRASDAHLGTAAYGSERAVAAIGVRRNLYAAAHGFSRRLEPRPRHVQIE